MVDAVDYEVPQPSPPAADVPICKDTVAVLFLVRNQLVAFAGPHLHLLLKAAFVHLALSVASELPVVTLLLVSLNLLLFLYVEEVAVLHLPAIRSDRKVLLPGHIRVRRVLVVSLTLNSRLYG